MPIPLFSGGNEMSEVASVYQDAIWRKESAPGANDGTWYKLFNTSIEVDTELTIRNYRKQGSKFGTARSIGKEHSTGKLSGDQAFNDILLLASGLLTKGATNGTAAANNGRFSVGVGAATAGTFTLTYGGQTTAPIAHNASAAAVKTALVALSSIASTDLVDVTGAAPSWVVTFRGSLSIGGALTGSGTSLTGGTFAITTTANTGSAVMRYPMTSLYNTADDPQTYNLQKGATGIADGAVEVPSLYISGLSFKWTPTEATFTGDVFGDQMTDPVTMETNGIVNVPVAEVDPSCMSVWIGKHLIGSTGRQKKLLRLLDLELNISGKWNPLKTINCDDPGISAGVEAAPTSDVKFTISHDDTSKLLLADVRVGDVQYITFEALGPVDSLITGYRHRLWWTAAVSITGINKSDMDGLYAATYEGQIQFTDEAGYAIKMVVDTTFDIT